MFTWSTNNTVYGYVWPRVECTARQISRLDMVDATEGFYENKKSELVLIYYV